MQTVHKYEWLLAAVIAARATSFLISKIVLAQMATFNLLAVRFLLAFVLLLFISYKRVRHIKKREILAGMAVGGLFFLMMAAELTALRLANSSTVSLLENCAIIFVPLVEAALLRKSPDKSTVICAGIALLGVFCLTADVGILSFGAVLGLLAALIYTAAILVTAKVSHGDADALCIGIVQVGTIGILALAASCIFETPTLPTDTAQWLLVAVLAVVCTGFGFTLQPLAQSRISAARAGLFCAISPAIAAILGVLVLHERFTPLTAIGLVLILISMIKHK